MKKIIVTIIILTIAAAIGYLVFASLKPKNEIPKTPRGGAIEGGAAVEAGSAGL